MNDAFTRTYTNASYADVTTIQHAGRVISLARDGQRNLHYSVLDPAPGADADGWFDQPRLLPFPDELAVVGFAATDQVRMPVHRRGSAAPVAGGAVIAPDQRDEYWSTTARLGADAPFHVLSDGRYLVLFRQSISATAESDRSRQVSVGNHGEMGADGGGRPTWIVDDVVLMDRYLLVDDELVLPREVRYQRSRSRTRPASSKDGLGSIDLEGTPFIEPTTALGFVGRVSGDAFSVFLTPTAVAEVQRWNFAVHSRRSGLIELVSCERSADGRFSTRGTPFYTCRDHPDVFVASPGTCAEPSRIALQVCGLDLVPHTDAGGDGGSAVLFSADDGALELGAVDALGTGFTVEAWLKVSATDVGGERAFLGRGFEGVPGSLAVWVRDGRSLRISFEVAGTLCETTTGPVLGTGRWHHLAITFDGSTTRVYIDGRIAHVGDPVDTGLAGAGASVGPGAGAPGRVGDYENGFRGEVDEIRLWRRCRGGRELRSQMSTRLTGLEVSLAAYWRLDDAGGNLARDAAAGAAHGVLVGVGWVPSTAPVLDGLGVRRVGFAVRDRQITTGVTAVLYHRQERPRVGYAAEPAAVKTAARVLLAFGTARDATEGDHTTEVTALDLAVARDGTLTRLPGELRLERLEPPAPEDASSPSLLRDLVEREREVADHTENLRALVHQITDPRAPKQFLADVIAADGRRIRVPPGLAPWVTEAVSAFWNHTEANAEAITAARTFEEWVAGLTVSVHQFSGWNASGVVGKGIGAYRVSDYRDSGGGLVVDGMSSVHIPTGLQVTVFHGGNFDGGSLTLSRSVSLLPAGWDEKVGSWQVRADPKLVMEQAERLRVAKEGLDAARAVVQRLSTSTTAAARSLEEASAETYSRLLTAEERARQCRDRIEAVASIVMPLVQIDSRGLTATGSVLAPVTTTTTPALFESALGRVGLYHRRADGALAVAHYDVNADRMSFALDAQRGTVHVTARSADLHGPSSRGAGQAASDALAVELGEGRQPGTCDCILTLTSGSGRTVQERWLDAPKDANAFAALLAGSPTAPYDHTRASSTDPAADLARGSQLVSVTAPDGAGDLAVRTPPVELVPAHGCHWFAEAAGNALGFDGSGTSAWPVDPDLSRFSTTGTLTVEAWVEPHDVGGEMTVATARVPRDDGHDCAWSLGLRPVDLESASLRLDGELDWLELDGDLLAEPGAPFTVQCWVRPARLRGRQAVVSVSTDSASPEWALRIDGDRYQFGFAHDGEVHTATGSSHPEDLDRWTHLAGRWDGQEVSVFRNGVLEGRLLVSADLSGDPRATEGATWAAGATASGTEDLLSGCVDDIRVWSCALPATEVASAASSLAAEADSPTADAATLPLGRWTFRRGLGAAPETPRSTMHGTPLTAPPRHPNLAVVATVGGRTVESVSPVASHEWVHLGLVVREGRAVHFAGDGWLDCGNSVVLDLDADLTIEAEVQVDDLTRTQPLFWRGPREGGDAGEGSPYGLSVDPQGRLVFRYLTVEQMPSPVWRSAPVFRSPGEFHHVAVTRTVTSTTATTVAATAATNGTTGAPASDAASVSRTITVRFFVDGEPVPGGSSHLVGRGQAEPAGSSAPTLIGAFPPAVMGRGTTLPGLRGAVGDVRLWNVARSEGQIGVDVVGHEAGLVGRWRPETGTGAVVADGVSTNHARLRGTMTWVPTPAPRGDRVVLLVDGRPVSTRPVAWPEPPPREPHFVIGCRPDASLPLRGRIDEVRLWRTIRTTEQVQDSMFRRLTGERNDLVARYAFGPLGNRAGATGSTPPAEHTESTEPTGSTESTGSGDVVSDDGVRTIEDLGPRGNTLETNARFLLSTAPVSDDAPQVGSAMLDVPRSRVAAVDGTPRVAEYGDLQFDADGTALGVYKRCYAFATDGVWRLVAGFKVGDLVTEWVGQVQFDPQLKGFIEGAPPVPSENLTREDDYRNASSVTLTEAESTTMSVSSSIDRGEESATSFSAKAGVNAESSAGFLFLSTVFSARIMAGRSGSSSTATSWLGDAERVQQLSVSRASSMSLRGHREREAAHPELGARWLPDNTGYALVESETADLYALRLEHTGAMVGYQISPNPDIPRDRNIITFRINPGYTKQGVLDGKVGREPDASYAQALAYSPDCSYFKPAEAYALKNQINQQRQRQRTLHDQFAAGDLARRGTSAPVLPSPVGHDLVNTYVWTADGGLFAEEEQATDGRSEMTGGSYSYVHDSGIVFAGDLTLFGAGVETEYDASSGGHLNVTMSKTSESSTGFGVSIDVAPENDLRGPASATAEPQRGKVDAYRFMTFYLDPQPSHHDVFFNTVVDPQWLSEGSPAAVALAQARQDASRPACWRVMHRVTYVSRVRTEPGSAGKALVQAMGALDIDSNYELIRALDPLVQGRGKDAVRLRAAVEAAVRAHLPTLVPHIGKVVEFLALYYGTPDVGDDGSSTADSPTVALRLAPPGTAEAEAEAEVTLVASVLHESRAPESFRVTWSTVDGHPPLEFDPPSGSSTSVRAPQPGEYRVRATVTGSGCPPACAETVLVVGPVGV